MAQVLTREFDCLTFGQPIRIAKLDNVPPGQKKKWERFETDGTTPHKCKKEQEQGPPQQKQEQQQSQPPSSEMRAIMELLQMVNKKLDALLANSGTKTPK